MTDSLALVQSQHVARSGEVRQVQLRLALASPKLPLSVRATRCKHLLAGQLHVSRKEQGDFLHQCW